MLSLVLREFGTMVVEDRPDPVPGPDDVLVEVVATGICGSDLHGYTGTNGRRVPGQVMGHESSGRIAALGSGVDASLAVGDPVTFNPLVIPPADAAEYHDREQHHPDRYVIGVRPDLTAAFAERVVVPASNIVPLPADFPVEYGALIEPLAVAAHGVRRSGASAGDAVLVLGGGPIGQSLVIALHQIGVDRIVVSEIDPARRELVASLGAVCIDPAAATPVDEVRRIWGQPADVTIDAVGITATVDSALAATKLGGTVCLLGLGSGRIELDAFAVSTFERTVVGSFAYSDADFRAVAARVTAPGGRDHLAALISREVPLRDGPQAFADLARPDGTAGKVLVRLDR